MDLFDTIAAVSTPRGKGGIAVIRISGSEAFSVAEKIFIPKNKKPLSQVRHASAVYGDILSGTPEMNIIDDGIATVFKAPNSFTGEDTVEISCHGGVLITQRVLEAALLSGARGAMPGEYTKRAFVNGKTNLAKTEAVSGLIEAETDAQIRIFSSGSVAALEGTVNSIKDDILSVMTQMYAKIDYPEEDLSDIPRDMLSDTVDSLLTRCVKLKKHIPYGVRGYERNKVCYMRKSQCRKEHSLQCLARIRGGYSYRYQRNHPRRSRAYSGNRKYDA